MAKKSSWIRIEKDTLMQWVKGFPYIFCRTAADDAYWEFFFGTFLEDGTVRVDNTKESVSMFSFQYYMPLTAPVISKNKKES